MKEMGPQIIVHNLNLTAKSPTASHDAPGNVHEHDTCSATKNWGKSPFFFNPYTRL